VFLRIKDITVVAKVISASTKQTAQMKNNPTTTESCEIQSVAIVTAFAVWVIMAVVALVPGALLVAKAAALCAGAVINTLVEALTFGDAVMNVLVAVNILSGGEIIAMVAVVVDLESARTVSKSVDLLAVVVVDRFVDAMAGVLAGITVGVLSGKDVDVLPDVNANVFASLMTALEFAMPKPLEECNC